jgi:uncharacterized OB-fold protein
MDIVAPTPTPVAGLHEEPLWQSVRERRMCLQQCRHCDAVHYPPVPRCPRCLREELAWKPLTGSGTIMSWAVFHRSYLPAYPAPYNVIAVRLAEGPIMVSNLVGEPPAGDWIGRAVRLVYEEMSDGFVLPRFSLM